MKSCFVSNVSHVLRTPIATIKVLVHQMGVQPNQWQVHIDTLTEEADYQAQLGEAIPEISRVDAGRIDLDPQATALGLLAVEAVERHSPEAKD